MIRLLLPLALLLVPALSVAQPIAWSPEKPLTNRTLVPDGGFRIDVASDGEGWFVVWARGDEVVGTHVRADGSAGSPVATRFGSRTWGNPAVVWHRDRYLVVWYDESLRGQWVSRTGEKLGEPLVIPSEFIGNVVAVSNGSELLLTGVSAQTISILQPDGTTVLLEAESLGLWVAAVASDGESFLVVGRDEATSRVAIARLSPSGEVRDSRVFPLELFGEFEAAWNGSEYAIIGRPIQGQPIVLMVSREGVLQSQKELNGPPAGLTLLLEPISGGSFVAGWHCYPSGSVRLVELGPTGEKEPVDLAISTSEVAIASASDELLVVWSQDGTLRHRRLDRDLRPASHPAFTSWTVPVQTRPAVISTDTGYFAAWETRDGIVAATVGASGARAAWPVAQSDASHAAVLASSGAVVLLAWTEQVGQPRIFFRRFSADGLPLEPDPTRIEAAVVHWSGGSAPNESLLAATWTGSVFVIAWPQEREIRWVRLTQEGVLLDAEPLRIEAAPREGSEYTGPIPRYSPKLATGGDTTLLVWQASYFAGGCIIGTCPPPLPPPRIEAVRLNREGHRIDDQPLLVTGHWTAAGQFAPEVASNGSSFLVSYTEDGGRQIRGTFVNREGGISRPVALTAEGFPRMSEELVYRQGEYLLFWRGFPSSREAEIVVTAVGMDGWARWTERLAEAEAFGWSYPNGAAAVGEDGSVLVIYSRTDEPVGLAPHLWFRESGLPEEQGRRRPLSR